MKKIYNIFLALLVVMAGSVASAASLPAKSDTYVNDYANVLTNAQLTQLREDVKQMNDYYPYQIAVCIVSSFDGMDIDEYASAVGKKWNVTNNGDAGLLILVNSKSHQAKMLTSPDMKGTLSSSLLQKIMSNQMLPHFRNGDYYSGLEASLEALNNLDIEGGTIPVPETTTSTKTNTTNAEPYNDIEKTQTRSQGGGIKKWLLIAAGALGFAFVFRKMMGKVKSMAGNRDNVEVDRNPSQTTQPSHKPNLGGPSRTNGTQPYTPSSSNDDGYQSKEDMIRELEEMRRSMNQNNLFDADDDDELLKDEEDELRQYFSAGDSAIDPSTLEEILKRMAAKKGNGATIGDMAGKAVKIAIGAGAGLIALKMLKKYMGMGRSASSDDDGGLLGKIIRGTQNQGNDDGKPKLGGKPNLGGGEGSSATGSW